MSAEPVLVTRHSSVDELPTDAWDALAAGNFYLSHRWLRVVEADSQPRPGYLAAWSPGGRLAGAVPVYRLDHAPGNRLSDPASVLGDPPGADGWYPALLAGTRIGYASSILVDSSRSPDERAGIVRALLETLAGDADNAGFGSSSLLYLNQAGAAQLAGVPGWPLVFSSAAAVLPVTWSSFEEYLGSLTRHQRANVRSDLKRFARSGLTARRVTLGEVGPEAAPLAVNVQHKYGHHSSPVRQVRFFGDCAAALGDDALVFGCFDGSALIGFALAFRWQDTLYIRSAGFDYDLLPRLGEHFMVMYYEPIRYAIEQGLALVHFGTESFPAKVQRGCSLQPLWSAARRSRPFTEAELRRFAEVSQARLLGWDENFADVLRYLPSRAWPQAADGAETPVR
jgi:uncharacterized protein